MKRCGRDEDIKDVDANENMCYLLFWPFSKIILGQYNISVALMAFTIELSRITEK